MPSDSAIDTANQIRAGLGIVKERESISAAVGISLTGARMLATLEQDSTPLDAFLPRVAADAPGRERRCRTAVSATFLAGLELARNRAATLLQEDSWQPILVGRAATAGYRQA